MASFICCCRRSPSPVYEVEQAPPTPALISALKSGDADKATRLVIDGAKTDVTDDELNSPLHLAAKIGSSATIRALLSKGVNPLLSNMYGQTALHVAARNNRLAALKTLIEPLDDPDPLNSEGQTPLHIACKYGSLEMVGFLAENGADLNKKVEFSGDTPCHIAARTQQLPIYQYLAKLTHPGTRNKEGVVPQDLLNEESKASLASFLLWWGKI